ncbi:hypothetical protein AVEN_71653-1 [Araneus ventricosus]|uniref:EGF-like domain-containing protein n=1 Tax=Araneus ventricosus TaxID=182803 RepID=A0A4Y2KVE8_ARAVE|nr:hypothetical protein AVEN_71653-1 [Araneus ventricosus]
MVSSMNNSQLDTGLVTSFTVPFVPEIQQKTNSIEFSTALGKGTSSSEGTTDSTTTSTIGSSTVQACDCGIGGSCQLDSSGEKICNCFSGYARYKGHCYECDCGPYGTCILETGIKRCTCDVNYAEKNGKCEFMESTTLEGSTSTLTTVLPSTTQSCNCENGNCVYEGGKKICKCNPGYGNYKETSCIGMSVLPEQYGLYNNYRWVTE